MEIKDKKARFELKREYDEVCTARRVVDDFIRKWKFFLSIERGSTRFTLQFERPEFIYLESSPGAAHLSAHVTAGPVTFRGRASRRSPRNTLQLPRDLNHAQRRDDGPPLRRLPPRERAPARYGVLHRHLP